MVILDIDIDFFLDYIIHNPKSERPDDYDNIVIYKKADVIDFLEKKCGLNNKNKIKGKFLKTHDELFYCFRNMIEAKILSVPFELVHIDAHADLGLGDNSDKYIMTELLHMPVSERIYPKRNNWEGISEVNFLAFSIACRWIKRLTYVYHPSIIKRNIDINFVHLKDFSIGSCAIQLKKVSLEEYDKNSLNISKCNILEFEPIVTLNLIKADDFFAKDIFKYIFVTHSPKYTPRKADKLIPVFLKYIDESLNI